MDTTRGSGLGGRGRQKSNPKSISSTTSKLRNLDRIFFEWTRPYYLLVGTSHLIGVSTTGNWTYSTPNLVVLRTTTFFPYSMQYHGTNVGNFMKYSSIHTWYLSCPSIAVHRTVYFTVAFVKQPVHSKFNEYSIQ